MEPHIILSTGETILISPAKYRELIRLYNHSPFTDPSEILIALENRYIRLSDIRRISVGRKKSK